MMLSSHLYVHVGLWVIYVQKHHCHDIILRKKVIKIFTASTCSTYITYYGTRWRSGIWICIQTRFPISLRFIVTELWDMYHGCVFGGYRGKFFTEFMKFSKISKYFNFLNEFSELNFLQTFCRVVIPLAIYILTSPIQWNDMKKIQSINLKWISPYIALYTYTLTDCCQKNMF